MAAPNDATTESAMAPARKRVLVLCAYFLGLTFVMYVGGVRRLSPVSVPFHTPWWALTGGFVLGEVSVLHLHFRRQTHSFSLNEIPLVVGLFAASSQGLLISYLAGTGVALLFGRQRPLKLAFNLSHFAFEGCTALLVFHSVADGSPRLGPSMWIAAFAAAITVSQLSALSVTLAISVHEGRPHLGQLPRVLVAGGASALVNTTLALVAVTVLWQDVRAGWLLLVVAVIVLIAYRAYASLSSRHASLELLYEFTRVVSTSPRPETIVKAVLSEARELLRAEVAEIVLLPAAGEIWSRRMSLTNDDRMITQEIDRPETDQALARVISEGLPLVLPRSTKDSELRRYLDERDVRDCIIAPLRAENEVIGVIAVADHMGDVRTFNDDDAKLFETIANHASVALQKGRLIARLSYEALHDALTGLPNRTLFQRQVDDALRSPGEGTNRLAVMLMDLDRFKEVNDSLGHHNGDVLLKEVGARLRAALDDKVMVARLGGDEFGILVPDVPDDDHALHVAGDIQRALDLPFAHRDLTLEVGASIGIALFPDHGGDAATLLQRADVAMYEAKGSNTGLVVFEAKLDQYSPRRLALVGELRRAIEREELTVHFQPKAALPHGAVIGTEALVRWPHPERGVVFPDEFIPIAEHTGLIGPLTMFVLRTALRQCRTWQDSGLDVSIAVNLSARTLLDVELPDQVGRLLAAARVDARALTLEITESTIMSDPGRTVGVLERLSTMGVALSIDDFGTGYSSLSYLKRLPVTEVKVDKSFVLNMIRDENDATIVRSTVDLAHNLGLRVVAEGVEDRATWDRLTELGCDVAQGYFLSRPLPADQLTSWLSEHRLLVGLH